MAWLQPPLYELLASVTIRKQSIKCLTIMKHIKIGIRIYESHNVERRYATLIEPKWAKHGTCYEHFVILAQRLLLFFFLGHVIRRRIPFAIAT